MATNKEWALRMIPVLIRWAQATWDKPHYYSDLSAAVGHKTNQIGNVMGNVQNIIVELRKTLDPNIPTLNGLVRNKHTNLPSDGFDYVIKNYSKLSPESKRGEVRNLNYQAHIYDWTRVLKKLGLKPAEIISTEKVEEIKNGGFGGGEGKEHKALKEYILKHPERLGIKGVKFSETEHDLLSGDRLDVFFNCKSIHYAIEVKPMTSPEGDIIRGVFQCVKYKAVMDAMRVADNGNYENDTLLVLAGNMPETARQMANDLKIKYIENFKLL